MDEVDNIIFHSLRQIGCNLESNIDSLAQFTPEKLVETVSKCVLLINPDLADVPTFLPSSMASKFSTTTSLAESCVALGFRGDIGYQTFLYSNVTEVRRVFMFLIERLPKETEKTVNLSQPLDKISEIEHAIHKNIKQQLNSPWTPEYCRQINIRGTTNDCSEAVSLKPFNAKNLKVPFVTQKDITNEIKEYWMRNTPTIFQQTTSNTLYPSIIHTNSNKRTCESISQTTSTSIAVLKQLSGLDSKSNLSSPEHVIAKTLGDMSLLQQSHSSDGTRPQAINPLAIINGDIEKLKEQLEVAASEQTGLVDLQHEQGAQQTDGLSVVQQLKDEKRVKERTRLLLENPETNMQKLESIMLTTRERMKRLELQWDEHRQPLVETLEKATEKNSSKFSMFRQIQVQIDATKSKSNEIIADVRQKFQLHQQLVEELEKVDKNMNRTAYTSRILEIIGNITKQNIAIEKVLQDTRMLQKQINTISGQLDRQFTVTDDLIYKTAKRDECSKKSYKLLATLHTDCDELVKLVQETGTTARDIRDLEDQIEQEERVRNVVGNLQRITHDLVEMQKESAELVGKIKEFENNELNHDDEES